METTRKNLFIEALKPKIKEYKQSFYLLRRNTLTFISFCVIVILFIVAILAPIIAPYPTHIESEADIANKFLSPSSEYFFGTDELGRDIFSRILYGTRVSLISALLSVGLALLIGVPLGAIAPT